MKPIAAALILFAARVFADRPDEGAVIFSQLRVILGFAQRDSQRGESRLLGFHLQRVIVNNDAIKIKQTCSCHAIRSPPRYFVQSPFRAAAPSPGPGGVARPRGLSRQQVLRLWTAGRLPGDRFARQLRFSREDLEHVMAQNYNGSTMARRHASTALVTDRPEGTRTHRYQPM